MIFKDKIVWLLHLFRIIILYDLDIIHVIINQSHLQFEFINYFYALFKGINI